MGRRTRLVRQMMSENDKQSEKIQKAKEYALKYLSYRPRSSWELSTRLANKGYDLEIIALVLAFLRDYNFLDDEEFAGMWVRSRLKDKPSGRRKIFAELVQKGVDKEIIERHLAGITSDQEEQLAMALVEKKCRKTGFNEKKIRGFLLRRGFSIVVIRKIIEKCAKKFTD